MWWGQESHRGHNYSHLAEIQKQYVIHLMKAFNGPFLLGILYHTTYTYILEVLMKKKKTASTWITLNQLGPKESTDSGIKGKWL